MIFAIINDEETTYSTKELWQYDYGQVLRIQNLNTEKYAIEIHFSTEENFGESITRIATNNGGSFDVTIPDSVLENKCASKDYFIYAFIYITGQSSGNTIKKIIIPVRSRPKPEGREQNDNNTMTAILKAVNSIADGKADGLKYEDDILSLMVGEKNIASVTITGGSGSGTDGREVELQNNGTHIQWRYEGEEYWNNLVDLLDLKGSDGYTPKKNIDYFDGINGKSAYEYAKEGGYTGTEEEFSQKLKKEIPDVDYILNEESENAIQNKAVAKAISSLSDEIANISGGAPTPVSVVADMTDTAKIYLYTGAEDGYIAGNWYYYDGTAWVSGGKYGETNTTEATSIEPENDDIPKVFFDEAIPQTKNDVITKFRYISKTLDFEGYAEFKAQGNSSLSYPKKNMTVKMYQDEALKTKLKVDFKGWGKQSKHVYKANWIDLTHSRNVVSARLWGQIVKSRSEYESYPTEFKNSPNQGAVDGFPIKVYSQGIYQGRYTLNIPKDAWTFNMDKDLDNHCILCGENYASGCFRASANIDGSDWSDEVHDTVPASIKTRWNEIISFVMNSSDSDFKAILSNYFYVDSLIDYFIFGMISCGLDAFSKNQIYATYDGQKWIASMYDMDSTWGLYWNGSKFVGYDYSRESFEDYVSTSSSGDGNLLYIRLVNNFTNELKARATELFNGVLSVPNIINEFEIFTDITPLDLVKEDYASTTGSGKFTGIPSQSTNNIQQIRQYVIDRHAWAVEYFNSLIESILCTNITLNRTAHSFTDETPITLTANVTPSNTTEPIIWKSSNTSIATVLNGVVTPIANGNCTITATCGNYSSTCQVSVSGFAEPIACTRITLDQTSLSITEENPITLIATVEPSDTTDVITWESNNTAVATVSNGLVTPITNGDCVITVICGTQTATCNVNISGLPVKPLYPLENGSKTFTNFGSTVTISNGNHINITGLTTNTNYNVNISYITDNGNQPALIDLDRSKIHFTLKNGDVVRTITKFSELHTSNRPYALFLRKSKGDTLNLHSNTTTEVDNTITITEDMSINCIGFYSTTVANQVYDLDIEIYVNNVRYV